MMFLSRFTSTSKQPTHRLITRCFAVKELPWCTPKTKLKKKNEWSNNNSSGEQPECKSCQLQEAVANDHPDNVTANVIKMNTNIPFGIIAAMNQNRVIGIGGKLPWNIPEDRRHFEKLTAGKTLIIGRNSFYEQGKDDFSHVSHCQNVVVVSRSMRNSDIASLGSSFNKIKTNVHLVRSFEESIDLSKQMITDDDTLQTGKNVINCWVGGGQRIYEEALRHPLAAEIHLTIVQDLHFDQVLFDRQLQENNVAFFPAKYRYDNAFVKIEERKCQNVDDEKYACCFQVYRRRKSKA